MDRCREIDVRSESDIFVALMDGGEEKRAGLVFLPMRFVTSQWLARSANARQPVTQLLHAQQIQILLCKMCSSR